MPRAQFDVSSDCMDSILCTMAFSSALSEAALRKSSNFLETSSRRSSRSVKSSGSVSTPCVCASEVSSFAWSCVISSASARAVMRAIASALRNGTPFFSLFFSASYNVYTSWIWVVFDSSAAMRSLRVWMVWFGSARPVTVRLSALVMRTFCPERTGRGWEPVA